MFGKDEIKKLLQMPDDELENKIIKAAKISGTDTERVIRSEGNITKLKQVLASLSQDDINKVLKSVDQQKLNELAKELKNQNG